MPNARSLSCLDLSNEEVSQLESLANSRSLPHSLVQRAQIVLECRGGGSNASIGKRVGVTHVTVRKWRTHYMEMGVAGLHVATRLPRSG